MTKTKSQIPSLKSLGILGGTFDPPHYGHLTLAENARVQLQLDCVLFVPAGQQPLKRNRAITPAHHRAAMVKAAIADNPAFSLSRAELDRPGPHYTTDTLALLQEAHPKTKMVFVIGSDSLAQLAAWHDPAGIVQQARLAAMPRPGWEVDLEELEQTVPGIRERLTWLDTPCLDIAASDLRRRARQGLPLRYLVPPAVEAYIREHHLYETLPNGVDML
jgi:nicotinate-nucleotide adenylyltransferase